MVAHGSPHRGLPYFFHKGSDIMTKLLMVRHGQSEANSLGVFAGNYDIELTELGHKQAQCTANFIAENYTVDKVYASDLKRAYKTAVHIAEKFDLDVIPDKNFREISAGKWEAEKFVVIIEKYKDDYEKWLTDIGNAGCTGGETVKELAKRVCDELKKVAEDNEGKTVVIGTHATPVRVVQCLFGGHAMYEMKDVPWVSNASVTELNYEEGKFVLVKAGMDGHLTGYKSELPANV